MHREHAQQLSGLPAALADLGLAPVASGVIARRRSMMPWLERVHADTRAIRRMHRLRDEFGPGPVELVLPGRRVLVPLVPDDAARVLADGPRPFHPANREKVAALRTFQPHGVLISDTAAREDRRRINEQALDTGTPLHHLAEPFVGVVADEAREQVRSAVDCGRLDADRFIAAWWRLVRRVVLGRRGRQDELVTDRLWRLRSAGNWSYPARPHRRLRELFYEHPQLVPFSGGPARCPGQDLVLFLTSTLLAQLLSKLDLSMTSQPQPGRDKPLPMTFDHFGIDFEARARQLLAA